LRTSSSKKAHASVRCSPRSNGSVHPFPLLRIASPEISNLLSMPNGRFASASIVSLRCASSRSASLVPRACAHVARDAHSLRDRRASIRPPLSDRPGDDGRRQDPNPSTTTSSGERSRSIAPPKDLPRQRRRLFRRQVNRLVVRFFLLYYFFLEMSLVFF
jgi:hypothetical protein